MEEASRTTETIDKLYLELSQISNAKTGKEIHLENRIREIANSKSWEEQAALAEIALADIEERMPEKFALDWLEAQ